jgi:hypothetical protein
MNRSLTTSLPPGHPLEAATLTDNRRGDILYQIGLVCAVLFFLITTL